MEEVGHTVKKDVGWDIVLEDGEILLVVMTHEHAPVVAEGQDKESGVHEQGCRLAMDGSSRRLPFNMRS